MCRSILGPDLIFIVLNLTRECVKRRVEIRSGGTENAKKAADIAIKLYDLYEPAGEDEEGAYNIEITEDMSKESVQKLILHKIDNLDKLTTLIHKIDNL